MKKSAMSIVLFLLVFQLAGCERYENHNDCVTKELQKFSYEPGYGERASVNALCESKFPYEREIYSVKIEWYGDSVKITDSASYDVTKVRLLVYEDCDNTNGATRELDYFVLDGVYGSTLNWKEEYKCHQPNKAKYWGIMNKSKLK